MSSNHVPAGMWLATEDLNGKRSRVGVTMIPGPLGDQIRVMTTTGERIMETNGLVVDGAYFCDASDEICARCVFRNITRVPHCVRFDVFEERVVKKNRDEERTYKPPCLC